MGLPCGETEGQRAVGHKLAAGESESHAGSWRGICSAKEKATSTAAGPEWRGLRSTDVLSQFCTVRDLK